jgi:hypothetical protein
MNISLVVTSTQAPVAVVALAAAQWYMLHSQRLGASLLRRVRWQDLWVYSRDGVVF